MNAGAWIAVIALALGGCASVALKSPPGRPSPAIPTKAASALDDAPLSGARAVFIDTAVSMRGQPYRWGGAAPGGFDCSGLVEYAASRAGITIPRTAHEQLGIGTAVGRRELQAGDLVFLHLSHKQLHVGIAVDRNHFVHAPSTGGHVRIDSLDDEPYAGGFIEAKRIALPR